MSYGGGCFCGAVRYRFERHADSIAYCHCEHCRRSTGAPVVAWVAVSTDEFAWTLGEPASHRHASESSPRVTRTFCRDCGTAMTYQREGSRHLDVTLASLDDPGGLRPDHHAWASRRLAWFEVADDLPRYEKGQPDPK